jgi:hypothetical protein
MHNSHSSFIGVGNCYMMGVRNTLGTRENDEILFGTHWEHVGEHMLETWEHVGKPSGNPLLNYRQCGGNTLEIRGK